MIASDPAPRRVFGMRGWLAAGFGGAAGLLCIALALLLGERANDVARGEAARYLERIAHDYRERLDEAVVRRMGELKILALVDAMPGESSPRRRRERLDAAQREEGYAWLTYFDRSALALASAGEAQTARADAAPWFRAALNRPTVEYSPSSAALTLAVPLPARAGVLAAGLGPAWVQSVQRALGAVDAELLIVDDERRVLAGPATLVGKQVPMRTTRGASVALERWPDGERYLVASTAPRHSDSGLNWRGVARMRVEAAQAPAADLRRILLWAGLVLTLTGLATGWILATRHARPLIALTRAAQKIAAGDERVQLPVPDDYEEISRLAGALRAMLARLRAQSESLRHGREELRRRVHERTAELVKAQADLELQVADAKLAREELARAHEQLALALDASGHALWDYDVARDEMFFSAGWSQMLGGPPVATRAPASVFLALVPGPGREQVAATLAAGIGPGSDELRIEHPVTRGDGAVIWMTLQARVVERDENGRARRAIGTYRSTNGIGNRPARLSVLGAQRRNEG